MSIILRRRKLGRTSCREISRQMLSDSAVIRNDRPIPLADDGKYLFRWGTTSNVPDGYTIVNTAEAIHRVNDKTGFRRILNEHGLCPKTWFGFDEWNNNYWETDGINPVIMRPNKHAQG